MKPFPTLNISLLVVVCLPLASDSLMLNVLMISSPISLLIRVDLPTPEEPIKAIVILSKR